MISSLNGTEGYRHEYEGGMNEYGLISLLFYKETINFVWIKSLNRKGKSINHLEENVEKYLNVFTSFW